MAKDHDFAHPEFHPSRSATVDATTSKNSPAPAALPPEQHSAASTQRSILVGFCTLDKPRYHPAAAQHSADTRDRRNSTPMAFPKHAGPSTLASINSASRMEDATQWQGRWRGWRNVQMAGWDLRGQSEPNTLSPAHRRAIVPEPLQSNMRYGPQLELCTKTRGTVTAQEHANPANPSCGMVMQHLKAWRVLNTNSRGLVNQHLWRRVRVPARGSELHCYGSSVQQMDGRRRVRMEALDSEDS
ncbi:hypothetical protein DFP72DRAFT_1166173 [Ephemerocybe angulata]|uniref:Uncharacterized protein n=1 Tax=Ephemerocybe angulata TaxID=980116 RepID=A0A8H6I7W8_9AGAR|nr:hypothetical protein DFP72DRAFT_1166173 [Tulosesus angulatus]